MPWNNSNNNFNLRAVRFGELNAIIDERGSSFIAMRKVQWVKKDEEPDESKAKLEIRKYRVVDGEERADKGISFLTDEGPGELAKALIHEGYGNTKDILSELKNREDFESVVNNFYDDDNSDGEFFDMRSLLNSEDEEEEEDE